MTGYHKGSGESGLWMVEVLGVEKREGRWTGRAAGARHASARFSGRCAGTRSLDPRARPPDRRTPFINPPWRPASDKHAAVFQPSRMRLQRMHASFFRSLISAAARPSHGGPGHQSAAPAIQPIYRCQGCCAQARLRPFLCGPPMRPSCEARLLFLPVPAVRKHHKATGACDGRLLHCLARRCPALDCRPPACAAPQPESCSWPAGGLTLRASGAEINDESQIGRQPNGALHARPAPPPKLHPVLSLLTGFATACRASCGPAP